MIMKRGAERQLTKDGGDDDDDIEEIQDPQAFQKADEATLAKRQIRALPKRASSVSRPPSLNGLPLVPTPNVEPAEATPQPKFEGFVGFGAATSASNPFTFTAPPPPATSVALSSAVDTTFKPVQSNPTFASSLFGVPKPASLTFDTSPPKPATPSPTDETGAVALKYFKSLRGLNVSFLSAISTAVEKDPFCDVANLVESYKNLRTTIQSEFDDSSKPSTIHDLVMADSPPIFGATALSEKPTSLFSMPKLSAETLPKPPSASGSGTKAGGFTFQPFVPPSSAPTQLPFSLTHKPSESSVPSSTSIPDPPKPALAFGAPSTSTAKSGSAHTSAFSFAAPASVENALVPGGSSQETGSSSDSSPRPTSTTPYPGPTGVSNFLVTTKPASVFGTSDVASKPTSAFGNSLFGNNNTAEPGRLTPFNSSPSDTTKVSNTLFGNATASTNIFHSSSDKTVSAFGSAFQTGAFATGKPAGSIGNPVGFGFGSPSPSVGPSTSAFIFGVSPTKPSERLFSPPMTDKSSESTPQPEAEGNEEGGEDDAAKFLPSHTHDEEGEGEEDEETVHVVRCKVFRLFRSGGKTEWKDLGVGMLRLKKHKESNARRVLMRNSNTGRILINFRIHASLKPTSTSSTVSFVGYENSTPTPFRVRVKTEEQAKDLKEALDREIAAVQAASE